jgi:hypothetical protein
VEKGGRSSSLGAVKRRMADGFSSSSMARGSKGKKEGGPCGHGLVAEGERGEEALGVVVGSARQPAIAPGHRARSAALSHNKGARRGTTDAVRAQLTGGAGTSRGPSVSGGVREGNVK